MFRVCLTVANNDIVIEYLGGGTKHIYFKHFSPSGVYLPLLWEQSFCWKSPIALGYTRGHFSALVAMENDGFDNRGAGANLNTDDDVTVTFLPLVDSERKLLHIHFLSAQEVRMFPTVSFLGFINGCTLFQKIGVTLNHSSIPMSKSI